MNWYFSLIFIFYVLVRGELVVGGAGGAQLPFQDSLIKKRHCVATAGNTIADTAADSTQKEESFDEDLHNRQLFVYCRETMGHLFASSVLISEMQGLSAEIVNNGSQQE